MKTLWMLCLPGLLSVGGAQTQPRPAPSNTQTLTLERELTLRALGADSDDPDFRISLFPGEIPRGAPAALPPVPSSRLIGSLLRTSGNPDYPYGLSVFYDSALSAGASFGQIRAGLEKSGWKAFPGSGQARSGFVSSVSNTKLRW